MLLYGTLSTVVLSDGMSVYYSLHRLNNNITVFVYESTVRQTTKVIIHSFVIMIWWF